MDKRSPEPNRNPNIFVIRMRKRVNGSDSDNDFWHEYRLQVGLSYVGSVSSSDTLCVSQDDCTNQANCKMLFTVRVDENDDQCVFVKPHVEMKHSIPGAKNYVVTLKPTIADTYSIYVPADVTVENHHFNLCHLNQIRDGSSADAVEGISDSKKLDNSFHSSNAEESDDDFLADSNPSSPSMLSCSAVQFGDGNLITGTPLKSPMADSPHVSHSDSGSKDASPQINRSDSRLVRVDDAVSEKEIVDRNAETVDTLVPLNEEVVQSDRAKILHDDGCDGIDFTRASIERNVSNPLVAEGAAEMGDNEAQSASPTEFEAADRSESAPMSESDAQIPRPIDMGAEVEMPTDAVKEANSSDLDGSHVSNEELEHREVIYANSPILITSTPEPTQAYVGGLPVSPSAMKENEDEIKVDLEAVDGIGFAPPEFAPADGTTDFDPFEFVASQPAKSAPTKARGVSKKVRFARNTSAPGIRKRKAEKEQKKAEMLLAKLSKAAAEAEDKKLPNAAAGSDDSPSNSEKIQQQSLNESAVIEKAASIITPVDEAANSLLREQNSIAVIEANTVGIQNTAVATTVTVEIGPEKPNEPVPTSTSTDLRRSKRGRQASLLNENVAAEEMHSNCRPKRSRKTLPPAADSRNSKGILPTAHCEAAPDSAAAANDSMEDSPANDATKRRKTRSSKNDRPVERSESSDDAEKIPSDSTGLKGRSRKSQQDAEKASDRSKSLQLDKSGSRRKTEPVNKILNSQRPTKSLDALTPIVQNFDAKTRRKEAKYRIAFTGLRESDYEKKVVSLGGVVENNIHLCTVLIADKIRRTHKFLVALALGKPIVEEYWLNKSKLSGFFIDPPDAYLLKDSEGESNYGFDLARSLKSHRTRPLLADKSFAIDPDFKSINENDLKEILESAGGKLVSKAEANVMIVEKDDSNSARAALDAGFAVISKDSLVSGLLKYTFDVKEPVNNNQTENNSKRIVGQRKK